MIEIKKPMIQRQRSSDDDGISSSRRRHDDEENLGGYECKTCGKRFKSFQALGGHQGIHKKVAAVKFDECELRLDIVVDHPNKSFIGLHRCKQCTKEFDSGQALGGHMRRHRVIHDQLQQEEEKKMIVRRRRQQAAAASDDDDQHGKSDLTVVQEPAAEEKEEDDYEKRRRIMMMRSELMLAATEWRLSII